MYKDEDGYPTQEALDKIENWPADNYLGLMVFVKSIWWMPDWGWTEEDTLSDILDVPVMYYNISTGGWSGNESLIGAMRSNHIFWMLCWISSRRGGHFEFEVKKGGK